MQALPFGGGQKSLLGHGTRRQSGEHGCHLVQRKEDGADGAQNGGSWADALPASQLATVLNTTMAPGDTLFIGSGNYGNSTISLTAGGTPGNPKSILGVDTGGGVPVFDGANWTRNDPDAGQYSIISLGEGVSHWTISNLALRNCQYAIRGTTSNPDRTGLTFRDLDIQFVRHGFYVSDCDDMIIEDCSVTRYTKHAYRLDQGCDNVVFSNSVADLSAGDATWWDYSEAFPFGFIVNNSGVANTQILFLDCTANNNRQNNQDGYWNGDGFVAEGNTVGVDFIGCVAVENEDGGFDIKPAATFTDCVAVRNYRGFRLWDTPKTMTNCVATYPFRRSDTNPAGTESGDCIWLQHSVATLDYVTTYSNTTGAGVREEGTGTATVTNSILSCAGSSGYFTLGSVTLGSGTATYRPGAGTDPSYVNPVSTWNGVGTHMDSQTYGLTKGYNSNR